MNHLIELILKDIQKLKDLIHSENNVSLKEGELFQRLKVFFNSVNFMESELSKQLSKIKEANLDISLQEMDLSSLKNDFKKFRDVLFPSNFRYPAEAFSEKNQKKFLKRKGIIFELLQYLDYFIFTLILRNIFEFRLAEYIFPIPKTLVDEKFESLIEKLTHLNRMISQVKQTKQKSKLIIKPKEHKSPFDVLDTYMIIHIFSFLLKKDFFTLYFDFGCRKFFHESFRTLLSKIDKQKIQSQDLLAMNPFHLIEKDNVKIQELIQIKNELLKIGISSKLLSLISPRHFSMFQKVDNMGAAYTQIDSHLFTQYATNIIYGLNKKTPFISIKYAEDKQKSYFFNFWNKKWYDEENDYKSHTSLAKDIEDAANMNL